jgi:hypothetical protein
MKSHRWFAIHLAGLLATISAFGAADTNRATPPDNSLTAPDFFPIAVWLQSPANAPKYRAAGFNTYVGLWQGPTEDQLATLEAAGMKVVCAQNDIALQHREDSMILGWMHGDEPDNAQELGNGKGYGPPIPPADIVRDYERIRKTDPSRPVLLNLGQGVAWDNWIGRGVRSRHPEDYVEYLKGCDIASFDIYPANHGSPEVAGNLAFVAHGVKRLVDWTGGTKTVWNCIECSHIGDEGRKPTPAEVRAEAWMSIIHGSRGLIYFVHQFKPHFREAALFDDPEMLAAVTKLNREITALAAVIKSPPVTSSEAVRPTDLKASVATMTRQHQGSSYLFAVSTQTNAATIRFTATTNGSAEVLGEDRTITVEAGAFTDRFEPWAVHLYRIR